ncbi:putative NADH2 dehydrogenase 40K chain [Blastocladiella britannica]|nr:putative NADH2 dehydrogenase 40K chain [Blastocladiella britannica]
MSDLVRTAGRQGAVTIKYGPGGRASSSGLTVTVFGCTGFLGRYLVNQLSEHGSAVVTPWRAYEDDKRHLKPMGDLGQITSVKFGIYNHQQLIDSVRNSDVVYNLVGREYATKSFSLTAANVDSARNIAHVCREEGVPALVHLSHLSSSATSPSHYLRAKHQAEEAVRAEFPAATIVRTSTMFGHEDRFLHQIGWLANWPMLPVVNEGTAIRRPVYVGDVAKGLANLASDASAPGATYEFYGPKTYTYEEIIDLWIELTRKPISKVYPPTSLFKLYAKFVDAISPYPKIHPDVITRLTIDEVPQLAHLASTRTLADAGVTKPAVLEYAAIEYVRRYRKHDVYHLPGRIPAHEK